MSRNFTETLESRRLMSASSIFDTPVRIDQLKVQSDLFKFRVDCYESTVVMWSDILAIRQAAGAKVTAVAPAVKQFRADIAAMHVQLAEDRLAEATNVLADESVLAKDRLQALKDQGTSAETADHQAILTEFIKMQNDMIAGLNSRIATRQSFTTTISNDGQAVINAVSTDTNATVVADVTKYINDKTTWINTLTGDLNVLVADRTQLVTDLTAEQSTV